MIAQALNNVVVEFSSNEFEMRRANNRIEEVPLTKEH